MSKSYINEHKSEFTAFGGDASKLTFIASDKTTKFKPNDSGSGLKDLAVKAYVISVAISDNEENAPLVGMYKDSARFIKLVNQAYSSNSSLIAGMTRLNDKNTSGSNGLGSKANLDKAFTKA